MTGPSNRHLWKTLEFPKPNPRTNPPSLQFLKKLVGFSGNDVRQLVISDAAGLRFSSQKLELLLRSSPRLERLELRRAYRDSGSIQQRWPRSLKHLSLIDAACPQAHWTSIAEGLVYFHLELTAGGRTLYQTWSPGPSDMSNLRYLRLSGVDKFFSIVRSSGSPSSAASRLTCDRRNCVGRHRAWSSFGAMA